MIPYGRQDITQADIDAVVEVLKSDWLTQGPLVGRFESAISRYCGVSHAVAVNSGTSALHIACLALDLGPGDTLWTTPNTFVASANCALYCGASVDFVDIDPDTFNMSVSALREKLELAEKEGNLPRVLVPVHFAGQPCEMKEIAGLARQYGFSIIEDASHAIGARYEGKPVGNCEYSDITVFSFHPVKIVTTGEGGLAVTNREDLARRMRGYSTHCITKNADEMSKPDEGDWYYEQYGLGFNYRLTDIQAALGLSQLERLDQYVGRRNEIASSYIKSFASLPVTPQQVIEEAYSAYHLFVLRIHPESGLERALIFKSLREQGIGVHVHYIPVHTQPFFRNLGFSDGDFPEAEQYYKEAITLPLYPDMKEAEINEVTDKVSEVIRSS